MEIESSPIRYEIVQQVTCHRCGYTWNTRSRKCYVTCPNCMAKVKIQETDEKSVISEE